MVFVAHQALLSDTHRHEAMFDQHLANQFLVLGFLAHKSRSDVERQLDCCQKCAFFGRKLNGILGRFNP